MTIPKGTHGLKIWADDNRPAPEGWTWDHNVESVQIHLLQGNVEELSLDFDYDNPECPICQFQCGYREQGCSKHCQCHRNGDLNGLNLLKWMIQWGVWSKNKPIVHSTHAHKSEEMKQLIDRYYPR